MRVRGGTFRDHIDTRQARRIPKGVEGTERPHRQGKIGCSGGGCLVGVVYVSTVARTPNKADIPPHCGGGEVGWVGTAGSIAQKEIKMAVRCDAAATSLPPPERRGCKREGV